MASSTVQAQESNVQENNAGNTDRRVEGLARASMATPGQEPDANGFFGPHGGVFVPPSLEPVLKELADAYARYRRDPEFLKEYSSYLAIYSGRSTPLFRCDNLTRKFGGARIYLKRDVLNHLGAHQFNIILG